MTRPARVNAENVCVTEDFEPCLAPACQRVRNWYAAMREDAAMGEDTVGARREARDDHLQAERDTAAARGEP
jgi:hypothetical protein